MHFHTAVRQWNAMNFIVDGTDFIQFIGSRRVNSVCGALFVCSLLVFIRGVFIGSSVLFLIHTVAPVTPPFGCGDPAPLLHLRLCVNVFEVPRVEIDPPLEVVLEVQYWQTEPV